MKEIVIWLLVTAILVVLFLIMMGVAIVKKNKRLAVLSIVPVVVAMISAGVALFKIMNKGYKRAKQITWENPFKERTGGEIYTALFEQSPNNCVTVQNKKDQYVPGLDCCIWLEFSTCPAELKRILQQEDYTMKIQNSAAINISGDNEKPAWWKPEQLGDTVLFFSCDIEGKRLQQLISSKDSTKVFYCDMLY